jgi:small subunit ribosomal protein S4
MGADHQRNVAYKENIIVARYLESKCKLCRREGEKLFLKGEKCFTDKCAIERRNYPPGQHGQKKSRLSDYGVQLREKQKLRRIYGLLEKQFRNLYKKADKQKGITGDNLLQMLESRLDNIAYLMGFGSSRAEARQIVRHNSVLVNGKRVNTPSYIVKPGDLIELDKKAKEHLRLKSSIQAADNRGFPAWIEMDVKEMKGLYKNRPDRADLSSTINESLVVELYSK